MPYEQVLTGGQAGQANSNSRSEAEESKDPNEPGNARMGGRMG